MKGGWRLRDATLFAAAMMLLWALSPYVTGQKEPWDSGYYLFALAGFVFVAGLFATRPSWWMFLGTVTGQVLYPLLFLQSGPLAVLGCIFAVVYSALPTAAGIVAVVLRSTLGRRRTMPEL